MLKIPKSQQEDVNRRTTDNEQKKKGKRANNDLQNITKKTKILSNTSLTKNSGELRSLPFSSIEVIRVMVFNATFNNISAKSWQSVLLMEETTNITNKL